MPEAFGLLGEPLGVETLDGLDDAAVKPAPALRLGAGDAARWRR
jgi:hypothetical protein